MRSAASGFGVWLGRWNLSGWVLGITAVAIAFLHSTGQAADETKKGRSVTYKKFGKTPDGIEAAEFICANGHGAKMTITNYGARLVALEVPDRNGKLANVTLGLDSAEKYAAHTAYFGCTTGRFANRIAHARFALDGKEYKLAANNGVNHLHGGIKGFDRQVWRIDRASTPEALGMKFSLTSPDGDEGYPGTLDVSVTFLLTEDNSVRIEYTATAVDKPTVLNLTNHAYWNFAGAGNGDVLGHRLFIAADNYLAVDDGLIPTGKLAPVKGTPLDFTEPHEIGARIAETKQKTLGYDHCFVLRGKKGELELAARVEEPASGRVMEVYTTEPAVQLYTANHLDGGEKNGGFKQYGAFCLETQHYPDSPNQPAFPTTTLKPGETYRQTTVYKFLTK